MHTVHGFSRLRAQLQRSEEHLHASMAVISMHSADRDAPSRLDCTLSPKAWACFLLQQVHLLYCLQKGKSAGAG